MKKLKVLMMLGVVTVAGCDMQAQMERAERISESANYSAIDEVCIDGVVYLLYNRSYRGGITPKINAEYYPYTCNSIPR